MRILNPGCVIIAQAIQRLRKCQKNLEQIINMCQLSLDFL